MQHPINIRNTDNSKNEQDGQQAAAGDNRSCCRAGEKGVDLDYVVQAEVVLDPRGLIRKGGNQQWSCCCGTEDRGTENRRPLALHHGADRCFQAPPDLTTRTAVKEAAKNEVSEQEEQRWCEMLTIGSEGSQETGSWKDSHIEEG